MAEAVTWNELKAKRLGGLKFVRQMPIGPYFADFACRERKLVVELDGSQHAGRENDRARDAYMAAQGWSVLRFWSHEALKQTKNVCETILATAEGRLNASVVAADLRFVQAVSKVTQEGGSR